MNKANVQKMYTIEQCSIYSSERINGVLVYSFNDHNMALPIWGHVSHLINQPLSLVSFDYHTDTHAPFTVAKQRGDYYDYDLGNKRVCRKNYNFCEAFAIARSFVNNDEQILLAYEWGYINSYTIICNEEQQSCDSMKSSDRKNGYKAAYYSRSFWDERHKEIMTRIEEPFILDIDLDYFRNARDFDETFRTSISTLAEKAEVVTVAKEADCFNHCKDDKSFINEVALETVLSIIRNKELKTLEDNLASN